MTFPEGLDKVEEVAIRLAAHEVAVDPEYVLEAWGDGGWRDDHWRDLARQIQIAFDVYSRPEKEKS